MLTVAILAGGLATRLRPITQTIPKALVDVAGKPFVIRQLQFLKEQGCHRVVLCIGYLGEMIQQVVSDGAMMGMDVCYSIDGPRLLGTGGALQKALPLLDDPFFVLYGDSFLPCDFTAVKNAFFHCGKPALMTVLHNANRWDKSNVFYRDGNIEEYNKKTPRPEMNHIDYGLGILTSRVFFNRPADSSFDLADVYHELSITGQLAGYEVRERFYEIGSHQGLQETIDYFMRKETHDLYTAASE